MLEAFRASIIVVIVTAPALPVTLITIVIEWAIALRIPVRPRVAIIRVAVSIIRAAMAIA